MKRIAVAPNNDGFMPDDVEVRRRSRGKGSRSKGYDWLMMAVRTAYRAGLTSFEASLGPNEVRAFAVHADIKACLKKAFPTSTVSVEISDDLHLKLDVRVVFPED